MNVSHIIHDLSFGPKYPGLQNPLDGITRILPDASGTFKYYIKVWIFGSPLNIVVWSLDNNHCFVYSTFCLIVVHILLSDWWSFADWWLTFLPLISFSDSLMQLRCLWYPFVLEIMLLPKLAKEIWASCVHKEKP